MDVALAPLTALATEVCANASCTHSYTHRDECECTQCDGDGHGIAYAVDQLIGAAGVSGRIARTGDVFLGAAVHDEDDALLARIVRRPALLDPEDVF